jgi:AcrR family transcriptional regulator
MATTPGRRPGRPRREPRDAQRARIVAAARTAFTAHDYAGTTVTAVAREAGVSRADVYALVGDKDRLLAAVVHQVAGELTAMAEVRVAGPVDGDRALEDLVRDEVTWFVTTVTSDPSISAVVRLSGRLAGDPEDPTIAVRRALAGRIARLHAGRSQQAGRGREASSRLLGSVVLAVLEDLTRLVAEEGWDPTAVADLVAEFLLGGYLRVELGGAAERFERGA